MSFPRQRDSGWIAAAGARKLLYFLRKGNQPGTLFVSKPFEAGRFLLATKGEFGLLVRWKADNSRAQGR
jgi:hypothetical protein